MKKYIDDLAVDIRRGNFPQMEKALPLAVLCIAGAIVYAIHLWAEVKYGKKQQDI